MSDNIETNIVKVLKGLPLEDHEFATCDFTFEELNVLGTFNEGVQPSISSTFKPVVKKSVTYVVAVVVINDKNEILMVQEAKESCSGKWYLPAGRVNKNETFYTAAVREVLEETGLVVECTTLLNVECASGFWARLTYIGHVTGGSLKTLAQADKESLQAKWIKNVDEVTLRADDILQLIARAREHKYRELQSDWHENIMVGLRSHENLLLRILVVIRKKSTNRIHVLLSEETSWHFPVCEIHPSKSLYSTLRRFMVELFGATVPTHKPKGILSVEHDPSGGDGLCITILVVFKPPLEEVTPIGKCMWHETSSEVEEDLLRKASNKNLTIPLYVKC